MSHNEKQRVSAVIVAAGSSQRMDGVDKVFAKLVEKTVLAHVLDTFRKCDFIDRIIVVLSKQNLERGKRIIEEQYKSGSIEVCPGGERRQDSVAAGLNQLEKCDWVIIHDGARPLVTVEMIEQGLETAQETGSAIAAVPVTDTIKMAGDDHIVQGTPPRKNLWAVQTPQIFRFDIIQNAYNQLKYDITDDARAVEQAGFKVKIYMASYDNVKITTPDDLAMAEILLRKKV
ncbi:2-C-methyl-D-erythritol 4-phosphate cytidylyltransferase [Chloroflexota bacterium]